MTSVGFAFLDWFHSVCIISFIENLYIYKPFLLYFHHPPLKLDTVSGKWNVFTLDIAKRIYISAHHGPAEGFVAVNPAQVVSSFADKAGGKKPQESCLTEVK